MTKQLFEIQRSLILAHEVEPHNLARAFAWSRRIQPFGESNYGGADFEFREHFKVPSNVLIWIEDALYALSRKSDEHISVESLINHPKLSNVNTVRNTTLLIDILRIIKADGRRFNERFWKKLAGTEHLEILKPITRDEITISGVAPVRTQGDDMSWNEPG